MATVAVLGSEEGSAGRAVSSVLLREKSPMMNREHSALKSSVLKMHMVIHGRGPKICLENCAEIMRLLDDFGVNIEGVREKLDSFLLENFVPLMARPDFLSYLSFEKLMTYLDNDRLSRFPEIELYEAVQAWLRHDRRRWRHTDTIIQNIRFCLMTPSSVFEKVKTSEFYRYSRQLRHEVEQAMNYFHSVHQQPLMEMKSNRIRSAKPQTAVFRGMIGHSMLGEAEIQHVGKATFTERLPHMRMVKAPTRNPHGHLLLLYP
ncbi:Hypothetical predicted protein [Podarcis lilfordi]|uniref:BACK domain-containing protein n=1 Tax=Podarcis lilfordi TaxID=74358 RepID=A0AA35K758_9SAUR|nr:Hypothetical predicted protein [Podarcis lilfordi]